MKSYASPILLNMVLDVLEVLLLVDIMLNIATCWPLTGKLSLVVLVKLVLVDTCRVLAGSLCLVLMFNLLGRLMLLVILVRVLDNLGRLGMLIL